MYELIEHRRLNSAASSITFNNIPQDGSDLLVVGSFRFDRATRDTPVRMLLNGAGFTARNLFGYPTSVGSQTPTTNYIGWAPGATSTANTFGNFSVLISNYTATGAKSFSVDIVQEDNQAGSFLTITAGSSSTTTAITTVAFSDEAIGANLVAGSSATLYKVNRTSGIGRAPLAMGGYMSYSNGYWVHTFPSSGSFIPFTNMEVEYLVIAGGGGGARGNAGGGGAGGYRSSVIGELSGGNSAAESRLSLVANTNYTVTVGAGGAGGLDGPAAVSGSNSVFHTITSTGGGAGGQFNITPAPSGGSGGGTAGSNGIDMVPGSGTANQGFGGGKGNPLLSSTAGQRPSGGGGGAAQPGLNAIAPFTCGSGGAGLVSSITGSPIARAGGGGGGSDRSSSSIAGAGGLGGGGAGGQTAGSSNIADGQPGTVNTGSGGGGGNAGNPGNEGNGGSGGSGIVIVRYRA